ncbi:MAG: alpha/beta fold hydrolase [Actinobacteria bacterium]|nr:alpha/beta fold hydrolase [Actinomycetota bacterium]
MKRNLFFIFILLMTLSGLIISSVCCKSIPENNATSETTAAAQTSTTNQTNKSEEINKSSGDTTTTTKIEETMQSKSPLPQGEINFKTDDGININGNIFGNFNRLVILSHMYPTDQTSWIKFAKFLNENNISVLTYDFRGYGKSEGKKDMPNIYKDLEAALKFLNQYDLSKIYLMGASMGGTASILAASESDVNGVITISAPDEFEGLSAKEAIKNLKCPKLFIASKEDIYAFGSMNFFYDNSDEPKEKLTLDGKSHGTFIFDEEPENGEKIKESVITFLNSF